MSSRRIVALLMLAVIAAGGGLAARAQDAGTPLSQAADPDPWPRQVSSAAGPLTIYQPQVESWNDNQIVFRAAVAAKSGASGNEVFGVIRVRGRTEVDTAYRTATLRGLTVTKIQFPTLADDGKSLLTPIRQALPKALSALSVDRLNASLAVENAMPERGVTVRNDPPLILESTVPARLVLIDGAPVLKPVTAAAPLQRVVNTRSGVFFDPATAAYYVRIDSGWFEAASLDGEWARRAPPAAADAAFAALVASDTADPVDAQDPSYDDADGGVDPKIIVSARPAELLVFDGPPDLEPIAGTSLLWATNTAAKVVVDSTDNAYYVLLSGRWFRAASLAGPWSYVAARSLPADFARIPADAPAASVLASVPGTPQAEEAMIENTIPQTATVPRRGLAFALRLDGPAQFAPIPGTSLDYVVNSADPIIRVGESYYAVRDGVWFTASALTGPWSVAVDIPAVIYTIPPSSPIYYVTYVRVYGATADVVYVGYTPGYFGTVYSSDGVVVYGTGYGYQPWLGTLWFGAPWTYGFGAAFDWTPYFGWRFGIGMDYALCTPWWGPVHSREHVWHHGDRHVAWSGVYGGWGDGVHPSKAVPWGYAHGDGRGRGPSQIANHIYASPEGQIHRNDGHAWQRYTTRGWQSEQPSVSLERAAQARDLGASRVDALRHAYVGEAPRTSALAWRPVARPMGAIGQTRGAFAGGGFHGAIGGGFHMGGGMHGGGGHR